MIRKIITAGFLFLFAFNGLFAAEDEKQPTRRFGIFIGSNNGGRERIMLRYAVSDAKSVSRVFSVMGGIAEKDNILLVEPTVREVNRQLDNIAKIVAETRKGYGRTELVFYYSGHSDENGILLNRERYGYRELRQRINDVQSDMRIMILDSCSSGAMTRAKGGTKTQPFLFDSSVSAEGYAILTSSSADEASQESDGIESSYFTHSLLAGLRGAADSIGDGRVTLNELYRFAYTETLAKTETSIYGAQHPSYDIQISGSGDVVLTDIKEISASLFINEDITGRISIRDNSDFLVAELTKVSRKPLELGLEPGLYRISLQRGDSFFRAEMMLPENKRTMLRMENFQTIAAASGDRRRGTDSEDLMDFTNSANNSFYNSSENNVPHYPFNIQFVPGFDLLGQGNRKADNTFLLGILIGKGYNLKGTGISSIGIHNSGYVHGVQVSGIFNYAEGDVQGTQAAGIYNIAGSVSGVQAAGIFNTTGNFTGAQAAGIYNIAGNFSGVQAAGIFNTAGNITGTQAAGIFNYAENIIGAQESLVNMNKGGRGAMFGLVNISESEDIIPFGLVNVMKNGLLHPAVYVDDMLFMNLSFRSGTKYFYSFIIAGVKVNASDEDDKFTSLRFGFGFEIPIKNVFINIDMSSGSIYNITRTGETLNGIYQDYLANGKDMEKYKEKDYPGNTQAYQIRLTAGYKIFKHLGIFGGISYDYFYNLDKASSDPKDFGGKLTGVIVEGHQYHKVGFFGGLQY